MRKWNVGMVRLLVILLALSMSVGPVFAETAKATTKVKHKPLKYFVPGHRISVTADVTDEKGVDLVRCYFKTESQADYVFVGMSPLQGKTYQGILPAPGAETRRIDYLFLAVNKDNQVVKTQTFAVGKKDEDAPPPWQQAGSDGSIQVGTEVAQTPETMAGFSDSIVLDVVESSARFGIVAGGIYAVTAAELGGTSGAAAAASAGTISASAGLSTAAIVGISAGVAAAAAGGVAAASSGGSDGDGGNGGDGGVVTGQCNDFFLPGNDDPVEEAIEMGRTSGTFAFEYDTQYQEDQLIVLYENTELFDSGCVGTIGTKIETISYSGNSSKITVKVIPNCAGGSGTAWSFKVSCPN